MPQFSLAMFITKKPYETNVVKFCDKFYEALLLSAIDTFLTA